MKKKQSSKSYISSFFLLIVLMVVTYYFIFKNCNLKMLGEVLHESKYRYLVIGAIAMLIYIGLEGVNFRIIGQSLGLSISCLKSICYACVDIYFCGITPSATGGQPILAYYMSRDGIEVSKSSVVILLYTVVYKVVLLFLGGIVLFVHFDFVTKNRLTVLLFISGIILNVLVISVCLMCMYSRTVVKVVVKNTVNFLSKIRLVKNPEEKLEAFQTVIEDYHTSAKFVKENYLVLIKCFIATIIERLAFFSVGYCVYKSFGLSGLTIQDVIAIQVVISITVDSLPLPGAIGISEAMFFLLYSKVYSEQMIAPAMLLTRGINFYLMLIVTGIVALTFHVLSRKPSKVLKGDSIE